MNHLSTMALAVQKREQAAYIAAHWFSLYGAKYRGGGGGMGHWVGPIATVSIYHQAYDGATNYHEAPQEVQDYLRARFQEHVHSWCQDAVATLALEAKNAQRELAQLALQVVHDEEEKDA